MSSVLPLSPFPLQKTAAYSDPSPKPPKILSIDPAIFGAFVSFFYDSLSNPLLRARTIQAVGGSPEYDGLVKTLRYIVRTEGVRGLYRGLPALAVLGPIGTGVFFATNYKVKEWAPKSDFTEFLAGGAGQFVGAVAWVPCATIAETIHLTKAQSKELYPLSTRGVIKHIATKKGILGFYPAFWSQNAGYCLFNGLGMLASSKTTKWLKDQRGRDLRPSEIAFSNFLSFGLAAGITTPIDTFKVCYQTESVTSSTSKSPFRTAANMFNNGGVRRFWNGTITRVLTMAPRQAVVVSAVQYFVSKKNMDSSQ